MKLALQKLTVGIVLRVVHAALVELYALDSRVRDEFNRMPAREVMKFDTDIPAIFR